MEENLQGDRLDDYVRKSFEEFEEVPPSNMWERVEGALEDTPGRLRAAFWRRGWQLLAAGVILMLSSTLVCEHIYYEAKIRALTQSIDAYKLAEPANESVENTNPPKVPESPLEEVSNSRLVIGNLRTASKRSVRVTGSEVPPSSQIKQLTTDLPANLPPNTVVLKDLSHESEPVEKYQLIDDEGATAESPSSLATNTIRVIPGLPEKKELPLPELKTNNLASATVIQPVRSVSGWYGGLETAVLFRLEKPRTLPSRPGRPIFLNETTGSNLVNITWFKLGRQWSNGWSLESGLGYQYWQSSAAHYPSFRFGDGTQVGSPMGGHHRNFTYDLTTGNGTAEVSLRMEQTQAGNPSDDEPVSLRIETSESAHWLRIPFLIGYQWEEHRWRGFVRAGLLGNMVVGSRLNLQARVSENARFKPVEGGEGYMVVLNKQRFIPGYWVGAGGGYQLGKGMQLKAELCFSGDFPKNDVHRRRLPERYLAGINLGLSYYF